MRKTTVLVDRPIDAIDTLRREHANMRSVLTLIRNQLDVLDRGSAGNFVLLANALYYLRKFPGTVHHPKEELIFEYLRNADPSLTKDTAEAHKQHREIYELEDWLIELALNVPMPGTTSRQRLMEFGRHYLQVQRDHSMREEKILFPRAAELLKAKDWAEVARRFKEIDDPLFGTHKGERYEMLYEHLMRESTEG
ncbi:MAG: hemerythrin domain-containing protein [Gammaproteobacteria bacterium]